MDFFRGCAMAALSHPLSEQTPAYGGGESISIRGLKTIRNGDSCNTQEWRINNHSGTHIDAPRHFYDAGKAIDEYAPGFWVCMKVELVECPLEKPRWLMPGDMGGSIGADTECLLIRTGYQRYRGTNQYTADHPGISPEAGKWLRHNHPSLRFIGFDFISVSRISDRERGRESHRELLRPGPPGNPILPIEDMDLAGIGEKERVRMLWIAPLLVSGADGSPANVMAILDKSNGSRLAAE